MRFEQCVWRAFDARGQREYHGRSIQAVNISDQSKPINARRNSQFFRLFRKRGVEPAFTRDRQAPVTDGIARLCESINQHILRFVID